MLAGFRIQVNTQNGYFRSIYIKRDGQEKLRSYRKLTPSSAQRLQAFLRMHHQGMLCYVADHMSSYYPGQSPDENQDYYYEYAPRVGLFPVELPVILPNGRSYWKAMGG